MSLQLLDITKLSVGIMVPLVASALYTVVKIKLSKEENKKNDDIASIVNKKSEAEKNNYFSSYMEFSNKINEYSKSHLTNSQGINDLNNILIESLKKSEPKG